MFNSTVLDVAVGLAFTFFAVSLVCSSVVEAVASFLQLRSSDLLKGVQQLVNDESFTGLAHALYAHAAVNPRGTVGPATSRMPAVLQPFTRSAIVITAGPQPAGAASAGPSPTRVGLVRAPAYIDREQFASALMDILGLTRHAAETYDTARSATAAMLADLEASPALTGNPQIASFLTGAIQRAKGEVAGVEAEIAAWFDNAMDRVSGAYKRRAQLIGFLVALALAGLLNLDCIGIGRALWHQPALAEALRLPPEVQAALLDPHAADDRDARVHAERAAATAALDVLDGHLAIGWDHLDRATMRTADWFALFGGWLLTAVATLFGAPFWFDTLQAFVQVKGSGPAPAPADKRAGAAASG